jgi:Skp family chaperone for outer membrane proteins
VVAAVLLLSGAAWAQAPANTPTRVAVLDFNRVITENAEGKKAADQIMKEVNKKQAEFTKIQGEIDAIQKDLQTKDAALSAQAKADMSKQIDDKQVQLTRMNEDAQKQFPEMQRQLLGPIADRAQKVIKSYADEVGLAMVFDVSSQNNDILYFPDVSDITTEVIRRIDADVAKTPITAAPSAPAAPGQTPIGAPKK